VWQIGFKSNTVTRMTTSKQYDFFHPVRYGEMKAPLRKRFKNYGPKRATPCFAELSRGVNRLSSISSTPSNAFTYQYNVVNQRTMNQLWDGSY
jgi:hypothetical protein